MVEPVPGDLEEAIRQHAQVHLEVYPVEQVSFKLHAGIRHHVSELIY